MKIGKLPLVPYHRPGDPHLGDAIRGLAAKHSAVLLANHGPVVSGTNLESAVYAMEALEETDKMFMLLQGQHTSVLRTYHIDELKNEFKLSPILAGLAFRHQLTVIDKRQLRNTPAQTHPQSHKE